MDVQIIAVSTEDPSGLAKARSKAGVDSAFIGDPDGKLLDPLGLRHVGGHPANKSDLARPASVLILRDGTLAWSSYAENYRVRPSPDRVIAAVEAALR
jgi:peroxiredoxin